MSIASPSTTSPRVRPEPCTSVSIAHERAAHVRVAYREHGRSGADLRAIGELRGDAPHALLVPQDLGRDVGHAQLVEPRLPRGGVALATSALHEVTRRRALAIAEPLDRAAADQVQVVVVAHDELVGFELARPKAHRQPRDDLGRKVAQRALALQERVRQQEVGALAHRRSEERLVVHQLTQHRTRKAHDSARGVRDHRRAALLTVHHGHLAHERGRADERERPVLLHSLAAGHDAHGTLDHQVCVLVGLPLLDQNVVLLQREHGRVRRELLPRALVEQQERTECERVRHDASLPAADAGRLAHSGDGAGGSATPITSRIEESPFSFM